MNEYAKITSQSKERGHTMDFFWLAIERLSNVFDGIGTFFGGASDAWFFAKYWVDFLGWIVEFFGRVAELFG